jgi:hypothetical protein
MRQYIVDERGKKTSVVVPIEEYDRLLEDLHDLAIVAERRQEDSIDLQELKTMLRVDGLLPA